MRMIVGKLAKPNVCCGESREVLEKLVLEQCRNDLCLRQQQALIDRDHGIDV